MSNKIILTMLALAMLAFVNLSEAQQPKKVSRIGYLSGGESSLPQAFVQALRDLGYNEGKNIVFEYRRRAGGWHDEPGSVPRLRPASRRWRP